MELENKIEEYEKLCPRCKGDGKIFNGYKCTYNSVIFGLGKYRSKDYKLCPKCNGKGKLDWIDKIKGIK